jgi:hypothetical protein
VAGVATDLLRVRVRKAILIFESKGQKCHVETGADGAYAIQLKPNTFTVSISGFCGFRRAAFIAKKNSQIHFDFQLWVCPSEPSGEYNFIELQPVLHTHLKPLVLYRHDESWNFTRPYIWNDGIQHARQYPAIFTFSLLTVQAKEISQRP